MNSPQLAAQQYIANCSWLHDNSPDLLNWINDNVPDDSVKFALDGERSKELSLYVNGECWLEETSKELLLSLRQQTADVDAISVARISNQPAPQQTPNELLAGLLDQHNSVILSSLPSLTHSQQTEERSQGIIYRNLLVLGSLVLAPLSSLILSDQDFPWQGIVLVEDDPFQLAAALHLFHLPSLINKFREHGVGFSLVCELDAQKARDRFSSLVSTQQPLVLHGLQIIRSPHRSPGLMELHSWLHSLEGFRQQILGMLGFTTDELNQTLQSLWSARVNRPAYLLSPKALPSDHPIVLVASGPSLDFQLEWLREHQHNLTIVAAGSALGSLLKANIEPHAVVYLERATDVFRQLCDLAADGIDYSRVLLIGSSTLDPRIPSLFNRHIVFHRPVAASTSLFENEGFAKLPQAGPHVINAALEALMVLGSRRFLIVGCDFGAVTSKSPRSENALGESPRDLSMPVFGNRKRTVFSEPELLTAHQFFERMINMVDGLEVLRLGEGVDLAGSSNAEPTDLLAKHVSSDPSLFQATLIENLPQAFSPNFVTFHTALDAAHDHLNQVQASLDSAQSWSHKLALVLGSLVSRDQPDLLPHQFFAHALFAQPLFFLLAPLHHASSDQWAYERSRMASSLEIMHQILHVYRKLASQVISSPRLPTWDVDWLRERCLKLSSTP